MQNSLAMRLINRRRKPYIYIGIGCLIVYYLLWYRKSTPTFNTETLEEEEIGREHSNTDKKISKWIVMTTIQPPTEAARFLSRLDSNWRMVVVGDKKTPTYWESEGVIYLDLAKQKALGYKIFRHLPYDSYSRKMIGYLYAIEHGAKFIYEIDDDNIPDKDFESIFLVSESPVEALMLKTDEAFYNPFPHFGQSSVWPRGFPLEALPDPVSREYRTCRTLPPAVQQGLAAENPDVDAIFRLTRSTGLRQLELKFDSSSPPVLLPKGTYMPYNSQNTLFTSRAFWSLLLPISVSARVTDIYRAYWAQALLGLLGESVSIFPPTARHVRNVHSLTADLKEESVIYNTVFEYAKFLRQWKCSQNLFFECIARLSSDLVEAGFWNRKDADLLQAWLTDLSDVGYAPPIMQSNPICLPTSNLDFILFPEEHNTTFFHSVDKLPMVDGSIAASRHLVAEYVRSTCGNPSSAVSNARLRQGSASFSNILLVIGISDKVNEILSLEVAYRPNFPHILYCGSVEIDSNFKMNLLKWRISYTFVGHLFDPINCVKRAFDVHFNTKGILYAPDTALLLTRPLMQKYQHMFWMTADILMDVPNKIKLCQQQTVGCRGVSRDVLNSLTQQLIDAELTDTRFVANVRNCFKKVIAEPTLQQKEVYHLTDIVFHIPRKLQDTFNTLASVYGTSEKHRDAYSHVILLLLECLETTNDYLYYSSLENREKAEKLDYFFPFIFSDVGAERTKSSYKDYFCNRLVGMS